jgi:hypothetical protein
MLSDAWETSFFPKPKEPIAPFIKPALATKFSVNNTFITVLNVNLFHANTIKEAKRNCEDLEFLVRHMYF